MCIVDMLTTFLNLQEELKWCYEIGDSLVQTALNLTLVFPPKEFNYS